MYYIVKQNIKVGLTFFNSTTLSQFEFKIKKKGKEKVKLV